MIVTAAILLSICCMTNEIQEDTTMNKEPIKLKEIVVKSNKIFSKGDKFILRVSRDDNKDGEQLLRQAPNVVVGRDDISIFGMGGTKVYVDNREVRLTGENLIRYLRTLSSKDIEHIEVQPFADASADANAKGGVVRIKMRRNQDDGRHGNVSLKSEMSDKALAWLPSASLNLHHGKWDFYSSASDTWFPKDKGVIDNVRNYHVDTDGFSSKGNISQPQNDLNVSAGSIYQIDSLRSIGAEIGYFSNHTNMKTASFSALTHGGNSYNSDADYVQKMNFNMLSGTLNYRRTYDKRGSQLTFIADYARKYSTNNNSYNISQLWNHTDTIYRSHLTSTYDIASANLSYKKVFKDYSSFQAGAKFTMTQMNSHNDYQGLYHDAWKELPDFKYSLKYDEYIWAAYAEYQKDIDKWSLAAGLRMENTRTENKETKTDKHYFNLYPHLSIRYSFDDMKRWMVMAQYARQIERPAFDALNPNRIQISQYSYQIGNPDLKPIYLNKISLTLIRDYKYTFTIGCNLNTDMIRPLCHLDATNADISYVTYENHRHENHWFVNIYTPFQIGTWLDWNTNVTAVRQCIKMANDEKYSNHNLIFINSTADFKLARNYTIELEYAMHNHLYSGNSGILSSNRLNLQVKKTLPKSNITMTAGVDNILNENSRYESILNSYTIKSKSNLGFDGRLFNFAVVWNFSAGKAFKSRPVVNGSKEERARLTKKQ